MKSIIMPKNEELNEENKKKTEAEEVKETPAQDLLDNKTKFTAMDMWNRQRRSSSASARMKWNMN